MPDKGVGIAGLKRDATLERLARVRLTALAMLVAILSPSPSSAAQYYTGADQARFAKLLPLAGTYRCGDTGGGRPYKATVRVKGAWLVWTEDSSDPDTEYLRWNPQRKSYVVLEIENDGGYSASSTTGPDPLNATWKHDYPTNPMYSTFATSFAHGVFAVAAKFVVNGKTRVGRLSCKKL
jgi:hypothetical protein